MKDQANKQVWWVVRDISRLVGEYIYKTKEEKDGMDRSKQATKRRETHLDEMNIDGRAILGIVSRMQQSLVHQDVFGPLDIHIQSIPKQTKPIIHVLNGHMHAEEEPRPGREAIEVSPEVVFETREMGVLDVGLPETAENLVEDLHFDALAAVHGGLGGVQNKSTSATLVVLHHH